MKQGIWNRLVFRFSCPKLGLNLEHHSICPPKLSCDFFFPKKKKVDCPHLSIYSYIFWRRNLLILIWNAEQWRDEGICVCVFVYERKRFVHLLVYIPNVCNSQFKPGAKNSSHRKSSTWAPCCHPGRFAGSWIRAEELGVELGISRNGLTPYITMLNSPFFYSKVKFLLLKMPQNLRFLFMPLTMSSQSIPLQN